MPLKYDDVPGSWGTQSDGWPSTPYTIGKWLLCTKAHIVPYGSYVVVGSTYVKSTVYPYAQTEDYSEAVIRCETQEQVDRLERVYDEMFVRCHHLLKEEFANG